MLVQDSEMACDQCVREGVPNEMNVTGIAVGDNYIDLCDKHLDELTQMLLRRKLTGDDQ